MPEVDQKVLTKTEVEIFLQEAKQTTHRFYPVWAMALMTGMRSGELFALKWTDIDFEGRTISVSRQWTNKNGFGPTKTQRSRVVPISNALLKFLKELKIKSGNQSEFVLPQMPEWENGEQARITREFCAAIGITPVKFHDLRATFITNLLARGESLARVMAIVGHTRLRPPTVILGRLVWMFRGLPRNLAMIFQMRL
ncbi:MAG TPA: site-specific integrase [Bdellovibrionales bacterium]|nr:site-specific integrase [Bdellovibrionales bacterium]